jgi:phosphoserine phosphatase RsbU/P
MGYVSRIALADVSGHGSESGGFAAALHNMLRRYINYWDQSDLMRELNGAFREYASPSRKYATAVILGYYRGSGELAFTNAGHPQPLWYHAALGEWELLRESETAGGEGSGLPVGLIPGTCYRQTVVPLDPGDLLVLYSDGITDCEDRSGAELSVEGLLAWARQAPTDSAQAAGEWLMSRFHAWRGEPSDDETLIVVQRSELST